MIVDVTQKGNVTALYYSPDSLQLLFFCKVISFGAVTE